MKIAIIGANGMLATMLKKKLPPTCDVHGFDLPEFDMTDHLQVNSVIESLRPELIINCAAFTQVDLCESKQDAAMLVNGMGPGYLATAAHLIGAALVHISTDFIFSGEQKKPYREDDPPEPLSVYGKSKLKGEQAIIDSPLSRYYIVRTSWLYGPGGSNFVETIIRLAGEREELKIVADQFGSPTCTADLAEAIMNVVGLKNGLACPHGIYHFSNRGECSWYDFACEIVEQLRKKGGPVMARSIEPICTSDYPVSAKRPAYSVLSKEKYQTATGADIPEWSESLREYFHNRA